jgi:hypothetical protein
MEYEKSALMAVVTDLGKELIALLLGQQGYEKMIRANWREIQEQDLNNEDRERT